MPSKLSYDMNKHSVPTFNGNPRGWGLFQKVNILRGHPSPATEELVPVVQKREE